MRSGRAGGKLTAADAAFAQVMGMVTQADGAQVAQSLTQLGIAEIRLTEDATKIRLTDGSMINGQSSFMMNGVTRTVASAVLMAETQGYRVVEAVTLSGTDRVVVNTGYGADGKVAFVIKSVTSANGLSITNSFDLDGNGVVDRVQSATTVVNANGSRTETVVDHAISNSLKIFASTIWNCRFFEFDIHCMKLRWELI